MRRNFRKVSTKGRKGSQKDEDDSVKKILSFLPVNRTLKVVDLQSEFALMRNELSKAPDAMSFRRVGMGSGTHLLKLTTPRAALDQCVLRIARRDSNRPPTLVPSVNSRDIPVAKVCYRPLEIEGWETRSLIDHICMPDELSSEVLDAFVAVFGEDCLEALMDAIQGVGQTIISLPETGEFPIIFLPRPGGGDLQATPASPAANFMAFKDMSAHWFQKQAKDGPPVPHGRWAHQTVSSKLQNISGAIGGPRQRFLATMPNVLRYYEAAIRRYALSGDFPPWREDDIEDAVLSYAARLKRVYTNKAIDGGTDHYADQIIGAVIDFIVEVRRDARDFLDREGMKEKALADPPKPSELLMWRLWKDKDYHVAVEALTSTHFRKRERIALRKVEF